MLILISAASVTALLVSVRDREVSESLPDLFEGDARIPTPLRVGFDTGTRAAQQLLTS
jgi:hypothetical protein